MKIPNLKKMTLMATSLSHLKTNYAYKIPSVMEWDRVLRITNLTTETF